MLSAQDKKFEQSVVSAYDKDDAEKVINLITRFREDPNFSLTSFFEELGKINGYETCYLNGSGWIGATWGDVQAIHLAPAEVDFKELVVIYDTLEDRFHLTSIDEFIQSRPTRFLKRDFA